MPPKRLTRCEYPVWNEKKGMFLPCDRPSFRKLDGKYYCRFHDPITRKDNADKALARRKEKLRVSKSKVALRQWKAYFVHPYITSMRKHLDTLQDALDTLVTLKTVTKHVNPAEYEALKEEAWKQAQILLADAQDFQKQLKEMDEGSGLKWPSTEQSD